LNLMKLEWVTKVAIGWKVIGRAATCQNGLEGDQMGAKSQKRGSCAQGAMQLYHQIENIR
jgi:hypothetical protein